MDLIAKRDFALVKPLRGILKIADARHPDHVHKGATFSLGTAKTFQGLREENAALAQTVSVLDYAGCIADATDEKAVKAIKEEIAIEARRVEKLSKKSDNSEMAALTEQLTALLAKAAK
jgi:hypothetical protein